MSASVGNSEEPIRIKKYANRRLYNTATSAYVTLDDLAEMLKQGSDFVVHDAKSGEEITHQVLTQIIFEQESKGENLLPIPFLRQLIRFYGDGMQGLVPSYLEISLDQFAQDQNKLRQQMADTFGVSPIDLMGEQVKQNMKMFNDAMKMFTPFSPPPTPRPEEEKSSAKVKASAPADASQASRSKKDELAVLKDQLATMQARLEKLSDSKSE